MAYAAGRMTAVARADIQALRSPEKLSRGTRRSLARTADLLADEARRMLSGSASPEKDKEAILAPLIRPSKVLDSTSCY